VVSHFSIVYTQKLVCASGHVDVERLAFGILSVKELVDVVIERCFLQKDGHDDEQRLAQIRGAALG